MAQLQFKSTDTIQWLEGFGSRADGDAVLSGSFSNPNTTFSGTNNTNSGTVGSNSGFSIGDIVAIHQSRNGGDGAGEWQLNKITNISGNTFTFKYKLTHNYDTTAQIIKVNQNKDVTVTSSFSPAAWNGSIGGIAFILADTFTSTGNIIADALGYRGGAQNTGISAGYYTYQGEGTAGAGSQTNSANGNGGGGGQIRASGGTGGHETAGLDGILGNSGAGHPGVKGTTSGNSDLTNITFGGAGGAGGTTGAGDPNNGTGRGGNGGAIVIVIARVIDVSGGTMTTTGEVGANGSGSDYAGGSNGAGGSILLKGQIVNVGTNKVSASGNANMATGDAAHPQVPSPNGRIHVDYLISLTGSTSTPSLTSTQDLTLLDPSGAMMAFL